MDGLRGLPDAIKAVFPKVCIQNCIIHQIRKFTKIRTVFPTDDSLRKSLYLATDQVIKKWTSPIPNWGVTLLKFEIMFEERINEALAV